MVATAPFLLVMFLLLIWENKQPKRVGKKKLIPGVATRVYNSTIAAIICL
jgi:hypothetical protein